MVAVLKPISEPLGHAAGWCFGADTGKTFDAQPSLRGVLPASFRPKHQLDVDFDELEIERPPCWSADDRVNIEAHISMGKPDEFPTSAAWANARRIAWPEPSVVVTSDFVEVRRILMHFEVNSHEYPDDVSFPTLHRLLTQRLRFR